MRYHYFPSCNFTAFFPSQSARVKEYLAKRFDAEIMGCCHITRKEPIRQKNYWI